MEQKKTGIARRLVAAGLCLALAASIFSPLAFAQSGEITVVTEPAVTQTQPADTVEPEATAAPEATATPVATVEPEATAELAATDEPAAADSVSAPDAGKADGETQAEAAPAPVAEGSGLCLSLMGYPEYQYFFDGDTLPEGRSNFYLYMNGAEKGPVKSSAVTVSYFTTEDEPISEDVMRTDLFDDYYGTMMRTTFQDNEECRQFWTAHKNDTAYKIRVTYTPEGQEAQTITVTKQLKKSTGVNTGSISDPDAVTYEGEGLFRFDRPYWDEDEVVIGRGESAFPLAADFSLSGDLATYFTVVEEPWLEFWGMDISGHLKATAALDELELGQQLTGALSFTDQVTGEKHTQQLTYTHKKLQIPADWYMVEEDRLEVGNSQTIFAGSSGTVQLRLYKGSQTGFPIETETYPVTMDDLDVSQLAEGVTATVLEDGRTVELSYESTDRSEEWTSTLGLAADGGYTPADEWSGSYTLTMKPNYYRVVKNNNSEGSASAFAGSWQLIPLMKDGSFAATKEELQNSGITLDYPQDKFFCLEAPVEYSDSSAGINGAEVWAYVLFPLQAVSDTLKINCDGKMVGTESISGNAGWAGNSIMLSNGTVVERSVEQKISFETSRNYWLLGNDTEEPWIDPSTPVVTGEPTVTGDAKDNLQVLWGEGLSSLGIVYNETQVPGQAVITIPTGPKANGGTAPVKNVEIIVNFANNATSCSYVLSGGMGVVNFKLVDDLEYAYTNGRFNFDTLDVARARFVEDGPFELFFYGLYKEYNGPYLQGCTFGSELVEKVEFESSDPSILQVTKNLSKATLKDEKNDSNAAFGAQITPTGKSGSCDITATITFRMPDASGTKTAKIGYTFKVLSNADVEVKSATPETLQSILDSLPVSDIPTVIELEGGEYAMDLVIEQKNVILRSKDPANPAVFTGTPGVGTSDPLAKAGMDQKSYIVRINPYNASLVLENIVIDGKGVRSGATHTFEMISMTQVPSPYTLRNCVIRNCVIGVEGIHENSIYLRGCTVQNCQVGVEWASCFNTLFKDNIIGRHYYGNTRFCDFEGNDYDVSGFWSEYGDTVIEKSMTQNFWGMVDGEVKTGPSVAMISYSSYTIKNGDTIQANLNGDQNVTIYSSPYYLDQSHSKLNVDLATTEVQDGTAILPLQKPESGENDSLVITAGAFAALKEGGLAVSAPIKNSEGKDFASWAFGSITNSAIETNLNISDKLSDKAQSTVDQLPESEQAKIVQEVNLSHNGELPGRATIRIKASEVPDGDVSKLFLYWVKEDGTIVPAEVVDVQYDAETNEYIITVDHCSEYVITSGELKDVSQPTTPPTASPVPTAAPKPTAVPKPTVAPDATPAPGATATPAPGGNFKPAPGSTATPVPAVTATPVPGGAVISGGSASSNTQEQLFSAQQVIDAFAAQPGDVILQVSDSPFVSQRAFALLMERAEGALRLQGNGYAWTFDRADLNETELPGGVFDTTVTQQVDEEIMDRIRGYAGDSPVTALETGFSGALPGAATLEITVDAATFGNTSCGLFYLPEAGEPERIATVEVDENGLVKLPLEHCSVYYLVAEEKLAGEPDAEQPQSEPETAPDEPADSTSQSETRAKGMALPLIAGVAVFLIVAAVLVVIARRRSAE